MRVIIGYAKLSVAPRQDITSRRSDQFVRTNCSAIRYDITINLVILFDEGLIKKTTRILAKVP